MTAKLPDKEGGFFIFSVRGSLRFRDSRIEKICLIYKEGHYAENR